ncbi:uncharacterized protein LOC136074688 [Hydra vulgaris]|uniref:Uncharacterized protein LOC136074688 n=1 Tax=Hydra vulgaris TaxID=6087 RepID=A0ABM4B2R5_HYDVU
MINCAYCEYTASTTNSYKCHLKVFHNKHSYRERLVCRQDGCPMEYNSFQSLTKHIEKSHQEVFQTPNLEEVDITQRCLYSNNLSLAVHDNEPVCTDNMSKFFIKFDEIDGIFEDSAYFISKLRSYSNLPLTTILKIVDACSDFVSLIVTGISNETQVIFDKHGLQNEEHNYFFENISRLKKPFQGLESLHQQTNYFEKKGYYIKPKSYPIGHFISTQRTSKGIVCSTCVATGQYVSLKQCLEVFLCLPGVLDEIRSNLKPSTNGLVSDFKDGELWKNHQLRLQHVHSQNTFIIPVFCFFDDLETANPLGSHSTVHKIGALCTILKCLKPLHNSKLENILLSAIIYSSNRIKYSNKDAFSIYIKEMTELETKGFTIKIDGNEFKIYVVLAQILNSIIFGLNGVLGYVESFTATYPCRICKMKRKDFDSIFVESESLLETKRYNYDVSLHNCSLNGIKEKCCFNKIPSFHVNDNIYCDIMHDLLEGICKYVFQKMLNYLVFQKKFFSLGDINSRMKKFSYDHSSIPSCPTDNQIKNGSINIGAIEMLNLVLSFPLLVGDLVPFDDNVWVVFLLLRQIVLYSFGLHFSKPDLLYFGSLITEFLQEYCFVFKCGLTLKFHNLIHYPRIIKMLGPLSHMWVMRCEGKLRGFKRTASSVGNFKNVCKTVAIRHQMDQSTRFMAKHGLKNNEFCVAKTVPILLCHVIDGQTISELIGSYGLYREIFQTKSVSVNFVNFKIGDVVIYAVEELYLAFCVIKQIFVSDTNLFYFICQKLFIITECYHLQAFEVDIETELIVLNCSHFDNIISPWPLKLRNLNKNKYVSLMHKI